MAWDKNKPSAGTSLRASNPEMLENNSSLETALNREHEFSTGGTAADQIHHKRGSARAYFQDDEPATRSDGSAFNSEDLGSLWFDSNSSPDNQFKVLTTTSPTWTPVSDEIIAVTIAAIHTWAAVQTFTEAPVFTKGVVANESYLVGRNNAGGANIDMMKVNSSDELVLGAIATLVDASKLASSAAPGTEAEIANKKYVDDQDTAQFGSGGAIESIFGSWTNLDSLSAALVKDEVYKVGSDGFVVIYDTDSPSVITILTDGSNPPTTSRQSSGGIDNKPGSCNCPIKKNDYWKVTCAGVIGIIYWLPIGTGTCVKQ